jgi:hypothetical protein
MDTSNKECHIAVYGKVQLERRYCKDCKRFAFVIDRRIQCCDALVGTVPTDSLKRKRISINPPNRGKLRKREKKEILKQQQGRCFWCDRLFGSIVWRRGKRIALRINWDHYVPFRFSQDNRPSNFVAACHVCNGIKASIMFRSAEEYRVYIQNRRITKGYQDLSPMQLDLSPETSTTKIL